MYDTPEMYGLGPNNKKYHDFCSDASATLLKKAFGKAGYRTHIIRGIDGLISEIKSENFDCDLIYNTTEGVNSRNREGLTPALLEILNIPFIGTDAYGLSLSLDKGKSKILSQEIGIATPQFLLCNENGESMVGKSDIEELGLPIIIKPNYEGNSSGIKVARTYDRAKIFLKQTLEEYSSEVLCEEFVRGMEITVPIIGSGKNAKVIGITGIDKQIDRRESGEFWLTSDDKMFGNSKEVPIELKPEVEKKIKGWSLAIFRLIGCRDFGRVDFRLDEMGTPFFLEINPVPSLAEDGAFGVSKEVYGSYHRNLSEIVKSALERYPHLE